MRPLDKAQALMRAIATVGGDDNGEAVFVEAERLLIESSYHEPPEPTEENSSLGCTLRGVRYRVWYGEKVELQPVTFPPFGA